MEVLSIQALWDVTHSTVKQKLGLGMALSPTSRYGILKLPHLSSDVV